MICLLKVQPDYAEGEMEEWDLVEEFFNRIREPEEEEVDDEDGSESEDED